MSVSISPIRLAIWSLAAVTCGAGQSVMAHTGIKDQGKESTSLYTAMVITHGCAAGDGGEPVPVIAQGAVFPNNADSIWTRLDTNQPTTLAETIEGQVFELAPNLIQDRDVFAFQKEIADPDVTVGPHSIPNVRAFKMRKGNLQTDLQGVVPFSVTGPAFVATSCVKSLKVRIAIANWCTKSQSTDEDNRADIWMGDVTPLFNDPGVVSGPKEDNPATPENEASPGFWPTLTINRDLVKNPLPAEGCSTNADGTRGYDVAVQPSPADIDRYLPLKGLWPAP